MSQTEPEPGRGAPLASGAWCSLHPRATTRWRLEILGNGAWITILAIVAAMMLAQVEALADAPLLIAPATAAVSSLILAVVWPPLVYRRWRYRLDDEALELQRGVIVQKRSSVPYHRVQQVDLTRGPVERLLGLTSAALTTASATTDGAIPALAPDVAEQVRQLVLARSGRDDAV
jgi:uncharacterized protein